jgi:hypothetical protein
MSIKNNIFDPQVLLETIVTELEVVKQTQSEDGQKIKSMQKALANLRSDLIKSGILKIK